MAWRFGGGIFTKSSILTNFTLLFTIPATYETYPHHSYPVDLHQERIDCVSNGQGYKILTSQYFRDVKSHGAVFHSGEGTSPLAGRSSHRSLAASQLLHLYHTSAWRTCYLLYSRRATMSLILQPCTWMTVVTTLRTVLVLPLYLSYTKITLRFTNQKLRVLTTGLEADLIVDTHPLSVSPVGNGLEDRRTAGAETLIRGSPRAVE